MKITDITLKSDTRNTDIVGYITFEDKNEDEVTASIFDNNGYEFWYKENLYQIEAVKI